MKLDAEDRIKQIDRSVIKAAMVEMPGSVMLALGLVTKLGPQGEALLPFLNDSSNVNMLLTAGLVLTVGGSYQLMRLLIEKARLKKEYDL
ncbi:MAG: hypothetical protein JKY89_02540 [Immundisolibacteraceae bacterium]|nr:hypothetical protein [Immundisolibacteraceae bacterium]